MFRLPRIILARKIVALVIDRSQCFDCFVYFFLSFQPPKNADFKNFRGFIRTPRTPPPYGPALHSKVSRTRPADVGMVFRSKRARWVLIASCQIELTFCVDSMDFLLPKSIKKFFLNLFARASTCVYEYTYTSDQYSFGSERRLLCSHYF